jgi:arabinose-5-phosphate isomerase
MNMNAVSINSSDTDKRQLVTADKKYVGVAKQALLSQSAAVARLASRLNASFDNTISRILNCRGRVVVCGMGKSGLVGKKMVATLSSTGTPSFFLHPAEAFHGDLGMLTPEDLLILISYSGDTEEVVKLIPSLKRFGNQIIAISGNRNSTLAKNADIWLDISVEREVCPNNLAPTTSTLVTMALGDALAVALIQARKFAPLDFARFHPGGSLGRRLLMRVRDKMRTDMPIVAPDTTIRECLFTMTRYRMGLVIIMEGGVLEGILTDGDLRRALLKDEYAQSKNVRNFLVKKPIVIDADSSLEDAEKIMQANKLRILLVTEGASNSLCGVYEVFS